jgi:serine/tyrosine/threonine adenylyltransferase
MTAVTAPGRALEELSFTNGFVALGATFFEDRQPAGLANARLVAVSPDAARLIDLRDDQLARDEFLRIASGNALLRAMRPFSAVYGGHQFGVWAGQLGDGRAIVLGEVTNANGEPWEIQLKGSGQTAFSRFADGRAVLRSTIREFLASEAMDALGIPTTRALAMVASDEPVVRETTETAAMLVRMAPSFVRFGSFEIFAARGQADPLRALADYTIARFYPGCGDGDDRYERFFAEVVERTARLMADWQCAGFMHGVMNSDNFSILGLTLDYGPYGFMEAFEPGHICNHSDGSGRYAYDRQPSAGLWNCYALANALAHLVEPARLEPILKNFPALYQAAFAERMHAKLGLATVEDGDDALVAELLGTMAAVRADFTRTFRALADPEPAGFLALGGTEAAAHWIERYLARLARDGRPDGVRRKAMLAVNPRIVLRNHLAQEAIEAADDGNDEPVCRLLAALRRPFSDDPEVAAYDRPAAPGRLPVEVSCSS